MKCIVCGEEAEYILVTTRVVAMVPISYGGSYCEKHCQEHKEMQAEELKNLVKWWMHIIEVIRITIKRD